MPSAARPFTAELVAELVAHGVLVAPVTLHAGVSSLERASARIPERYRVPPRDRAARERRARRGGRVIAVGTTVVRALETVADADGVLSGRRASRGWWSPRSAACAPSTA